MGGGADVDKMTAIVAIEAVAGLALRTLRLVLWAAARSANVELFNRYRSRSPSPS